MLGRRERSSRRCLASGISVYLESGIGHIVGCNIVQKCQNACKTARYWATEAEEVLEYVVRYITAGEGAERFLWNDEPRCYGRGRLDAAIIRKRLLSTSPGPSSWSALEEGGRRSMRTRRSRTHPGGSKRRVPWEQVRRTWGSGLSRWFMGWEFLALPKSSWRRSNR